MHKTTVYLPDEMKLRLDRAAEETGLSKSDLIREGIQVRLAMTSRPKPRGPLFSSGRSDVSERVDEFLEGFGEP